MTRVEDCIFCMIVTGDIPSTTVAETDDVLAFRDINPAAPTHVLLIPKDHVSDSVGELDASHAAIVADLFALAGRIAEDEGIVDGWRLITNVGAGAGQTVFHVHFHLLGGWSRSGAAPKSLAEETGG